MHFGRVQTRYLPVAGKEADLSRFTADEIARVDAWVDMICENFTAKEISDATHDEVWKLADIGETLRTIWFSLTTFKRSRRRRRVGSKRDKPGQLGPCVRLSRTTYRLSRRFNT